ncbi:MAG: histidine phosphatase family protein [Phycisphaerales bacterium]|nr:histidine phosphatase family protein [Phycisphaerales bacterium]
MAKHLVLVRHAETAWSVSGQHTGRTDIPLLASADAKALRTRELVLAHGSAYDLVLTSPLARAVRTCELTGFLPNAEHSDDLLEWNYGDYEGLTTKTIHESDPHWSLFQDGCPNGENAEEVSVRVRRIIERSHKVEGDVLIFAHGHVLRVLAAVWLRLAAEDGEHFALTTSSVSVLGFEHDNRVICQWNIA